MRQLITLLAAIPFLVICLVSCNKSSRPEPIDETFYISLSPDSVTADTGDTLTFTGFINSVENLFAITFDLVFDTSVVVFQTIALPQDGILGQDALSFYHQIDGGVSVSLGRVQTSGNDNIAASGWLFEVDFAAVAAGSTEIQYRDVYIIDENGAENGELAGLERRGAELNIP